MRAVANTAVDTAAPAPMRMSGITSGVRVLLDQGITRFYPTATSYLYAGDWLFVDDEADTLATIERARVVAAESGNATEGER